MSDIVRVGYLGPEGTYTHQAALERFKAVKGVVFEARKTIRDTIEMLLEDPCAETRFVMVPWENSTHGQVVDTYDALRVPEVGARVFVRGESTLAVDHCLLVKAGTRDADVRRVLSHEQALGQCRAYLRAQLPDAALVRVASTAGAAKTVAETQGACADAAIGAAICAELYASLRVRAAGIQDEQGNATRFMVLGRDALPVPVPVPRRRGLIRVRVCGDVAAAVRAMDLPIRKMDRRGEIYIVEVEADEPAVRSAARQMGGVVLGVW